MYPSSVIVSMYGLRQVIHLNQISSSTVSNCTCNRLTHSTSMIDILFEYMLTVKLSNNLTVIGGGLRTVNYRTVQIKYIS